MNRYKVILKLRYDSAVRTRTGVQPAKSYEQAARKCADIITYQAITDADQYGPPLKVTLTLRELPPAPPKKAKRSSR
ncbi:MAG: hypothetical protein EOP88_17185 [Verrucomicrobiaceae bacterium]|nr:MAG: hypothetical protein EOP88_17185 [Verrucomicrobiaceae bacterium]